MKKLLFLFFTMFLSLSLVTAQEGAQGGFSNEQEEAPEVTDEQLETFVEAYTAISEIQQDVNKQSKEIIEESSFTQEEFNSLYQSTRMEGNESETDMSRKEEKELDRVVSEIEKIQQSQQETQIAAIEDTGLSIKEYNLLIQTIQQDAEVYDRFQKIYSN